MDETENPRLIEQICDRDPEALATYIQAHRRQLTGFIQSITGVRLLSVLEIDDLIQEISTTALTGLPTAPLDNYEPMQWLRYSRLPAAG